MVANGSSGGLRFHDLRHSYATWLVTNGVPVNVARTVMGHEQTSTTLDIYPHTPTDYEARVLSAFVGSAVLSLSSEINHPEGGFESDVRHSL